MPATVLDNATIIRLNPPSATSGRIVVQDGRIQDAGVDAAVPEEAVSINLHGSPVLPGNICAHTHVYSALARGMPGPGTPPTNFLEILQRVWWRLDRALDTASIRASARVAAVEAVRSGTTTLADHHASPECIEGSLDLLADALMETGVRAVLCYEVTDRGGVERRDAGLEENRRFLRDNARTTVAGMIGGHASFTLSDRSLDLLSAAAAESGAPVHIHVAEDAWDEMDSVQRGGKRAARRLLEAGVLPPGSIAAHGVFLDDSEVALLAGGKVWIAHNCRSNMNNGVGRAPVRAFGSRCCLGTDGIDHDMFAETRTAYFRLREDTLDAGAEWVGAMMAANGKLVSERFGFTVGDIVPGAAADLVVLDYDPPTPFSSANMLWHWTFAFTPAAVRDVMVGGVWAMRDREMLTVDEEEIRADGRVQAEKLWKRMEAIPE